MALPNEKRIAAMLPAGLLDVEPPAPAILRGLSARLARAFADSGYREVVPPLLERYDTYPQEACRDILSKALKLVGPSGEVLAVRHDLTASVLSQLRRCPDPAGLSRVFYIASVVRSLPSPSPKLTEHLQAGVECCREGAAADREVFLLAQDAMAAVGLSGITIHVGHAGLLNGVLRASGLKGPAIAKAHTALVDQSLPAFFTAIAEGGAGTDTDRATAVSALLRRWVAPAAAGEEGLSSFVQALADAGLGTWPFGLLALLEELVTLFRESAALHPSVRVVWNPLLVGSQPYYNGLVFQAFVPDLPSAVALGGRYDALVRAFGVGDGGVGFTIQLSEVVKLMGKIRSSLETGVSRGPVVVAAIDGYGRQARALAGILSDEGRAVARVIDVGDRAQAEREASLAGAAFLVLVDRRGYSETPLVRRTDLARGGVGLVPDGIH